MSEEISNEELPGAQKYEQEAVYQRNPRPAKDKHQTFTGEEPRPDEQEDDEAARRQGKA